MIGWIKSALFVCAIVGLPIFGIRSRQQSEWWQAGERAIAERERRERRAIAERERRESTPHVVREADGCKVYAFKHGGDRYHYFTRCGSTTTTSSSWESCNTSGKVRSCKREHEEIEVQNERP